VWRRLVAIGSLALAASTCGSPVVGEAHRVPGDAGADGPCAVCAAADVCCAAHTDNVSGNCQLRATCLMFTGAERASVEDGCAYYLRVASTPPGPAACGPHPEAP
jgi:hypothetical protein